MIKWKDIKGYEGIYQISSSGAVRSLDRKIMRKGYRGEIIYHERKGRIMKASSRGNYPSCVGLYKNGKQTVRYLPTLMQEHFGEK